MNILVVGSVNMDLVVRIPRIPRPGETVLGGTFETFPGGKGANQAVAAARLGARVSMIGCVGEDAFGRELRTTLSGEGIDITHIRVDPKASTGVAFLQVDAEGQNNIAVASGANFSLTGEDVERAMKDIGEVDALLMPLETQIETIYAAARAASRQGAKVILNPAPARVLDKGLVDLVDVLVPNEYEAAQMTGVPLESEADIRRAADELLSLGLGSLLVTMGSQGTLLFESEDHQGQLVPAYPVDAVDTTAAGDCFVGALAVGICEGRSLLAAAQFASAAAALSVTRPGAQPSLPGREEVVGFMRDRSTLQ
jgi:ribokinase